MWYVEVLSHPPPILFKREFKVLLLRIDEGVCVSSYIMLA